MSFGEEQNRSGERERVKEWSDKKRSICKFCCLWWCWKGNVLDRQSVPLVKFFHCVSYLNQTLFQSSSTYSFFPLHTALFTFFSFHSTFFLSGPLPHSSLFPVSLFHFKPCHSLFFFLLLISLQSFANFPFFTNYPPPPPHTSFYPFLHTSQSHLLGGWGCCFHACKSH